MNDMRKLMETVEPLGESAGSPVYVGFVDEQYEGFYPLERWETTTDAKWAKAQANNIAVEYSDDIDIVVVAFTSGRSGFKRVHKATGAIDITAEVEKHNNDRDRGLGHDNALGNDHEPSYDKSDL